MNRVIAKYDKQIAVLFSLLLVAMMLASVYKFGDKTLMLFSAAIIATVVSGAILIKPFYGIFLIAVLIPFENFQVLPGAGVTATKLLGLVTLFSTIIHILTGEIKGVKKSPVDLPLFCFLAVCLLSLIPAEDKTGSLVKIVSLLSYAMLFYLAGTLLNTKRKIIIVMAGIFTSIVLVSILGILQTKGLTFGMTVQKNIQWVGGQRVARYSGSFLNPNRFVTLQVIALGIFGGMLGRLPLKLRPLLLFGGIVLACSVYMSYSRSAYLALTGIFLVYLFIYARRRLFWVIFIMLIALWILITFLPESIMEHFYKGFSFEDSSTRTRLQQYLMALKIFPEHWLLGVGIGNQSGMLVGKQVGFDLLETGLHCLPFSILIETGILGFATFAWLILASVSVLYKTFLITEDKLMKGVFLSGILVLAGYLVHNLFHNFMYMSILGLTAGIFAGAYHVIHK